MKNAILLHLHYQDLWPEFWSYLKDIVDDNTHLYVTINTTDTEWYNDIKANSTEVFLIENKGQDFGGFLYAYNKIKHIDYLTITKLHGKKSLYRESSYGENWRKSLYMPLIGTKKTFIDLCNKFSANDRVFVAGSKSNLLTECVPKGKNARHRCHLLRKPHLDLLLDTKSVSNSLHISGSMYMFSSKYLQIFFKNKELEVYELMEPNYIKRGSCGHHFEVIICNCEYFGGQLLAI